MYNQIVTVYDQLFPLNQGFLDFISPYLGEPGASLLDLGCGPGDYVGLFSRQGYRATGIDSSQEMIRYARAHHQGNFYPYSFLQVKRLDARFKCAYCIGNSLSYLANRELSVFLGMLTKRLMDEAVFVLQLVNWERFRQTGDYNFSVKTLADGRTFHRRYEKTTEERVIFHTELRSGDTVESAWTASLYPKYRQSTVMVLKSVGLNVIDIYGDYRKTPYAPDASPAMIVVSQKI